MRGFLRFWKCDWKGIFMELLSSSDGIGFVILELYNANKESFFYN